MRKIDQLLNEYGESHRNETNKLIHWICVPLIFMSIVGLVWSIPHGFLSGNLAQPWNIWLNWATIISGSIGHYYPVVLSSAFSSTICRYVSRGSPIYRNRVPSRSTEHTAVANFCNHLCHSLDRTVLWTPSRGQKTVFSEGCAVFADWSRLATAFYLQEARHSLLNFLREHPAGCSRRKFKITLPSPRFRWR